MARQHPHDPGVRGDHLRQRGAVRQAHPVQERNADRNRRVVQTDQGRYAGASGELPVQPGHLTGTQPAARRTGHPRVQDHDRERRVLHRVRRQRPPAQEARPAERAHESLRHVVVARHQVQRQRKRPDLLAQGRVLARLPALGEVTGDHDAVRERVQGEHPAQGGPQPGRGGRGPGTGREVRVAQVRHGEGHVPTLPRPPPAAPDAAHAVGERAGPRRNGLDLKRT